MSLPVIIIGSGGHARVLISVLEACNRHVIGMLDSDPKKAGRSVAGIRVIGGDSVLERYEPGTVELINGVGSVSLPINRRDIFLRFKQKGYFFAGAVHPKAIIMEGVRFGEGVQIMAGAIVQTGCVIGENSIINTGAIVDHDCVIGPHAHIAPGSVLSGGVRVGATVHVGTGAAVIQGIEIADEAVIGAGTVVFCDVKAHSRVIGSREG